MVTESVNESINDEAVYRKAPATPGTWTHGIDTTYGIHSDSWHSIGTPESHMYERAECCRVFFSQSF